MMNKKAYYECAEKVVQQIEWLYKIGGLREITYDDCGAIAEEVLTEEEYWDCTQYSNGKFITEIYQSV